MAHQVGHKTESISAATASSTRRCSTSAPASSIDSSRHRSQQTGGCFDQARAAFRSVAGAHPKVKPHPPVRRLGEAANRQRGAAGCLRVPHPRRVESEGASSRRVWSYRKFVRILDSEPNLTGQLRPVQIHFHTIFLRFSPTHLDSDPSPATTDCQPLVSRLPLGTCEALSPCTPASPAAAVCHPDRPPDPIGFWDSSATGKQHRGAREGGLRDNINFA